MLTPQGSEAFHILSRIERVSSSAPSSWSVGIPSIDEILKERACAAALYVAERLGSPDRVAKFVQIADEQTSTSVQWLDASFASGFAGLAVMYEYMDQCFPDQSWDHVAYTYMKKAAISTQNSALTHPSLFSGTSGMAMALHLLSKNTNVYTKAQKQINQHLYQQIMYHKQLRQKQQETSISDYDLISGASGWLLYLVSLEHPDEYVLSSIEEILAYLVALTKPGQVCGSENWYVSANRLLEIQRELYPEGQFNCGLSHGIPGPLAALAIAWLSGYRYQGMREAMLFVSDWLIQHRTTDQWGINWPNAIPLRQAKQIQDWKNLPSARAAWCYGAPGIATSLWLVGKALDDEHLSQVALEAIKATLCRPSSVRSIDSPTICHGQAGLLQICLRFAHETRDSIIIDYIPLLLTNILQTFSEDYPIGFRDLEKPHIYVDQPAWLTGATGVAMVLLAAATGITPHWDRLLALS